MVTFRVPDMTCGHCASRIARAVATVDQAARIEVNTADKLVRIEAAASDEDLAEAIRDVGYAPEPVAISPPPSRMRPNGCCCSVRRTTSVDDRQLPRPAGSSCCA